MESDMLHVLWKLRGKNLENLFKLNNFWIDNIDTRHSVIDVNYKVSSQTTHHGNICNTKTHIINQNKHEIYIKSKVYHSK